MDPHLRTLLTTLCVLQGFYVHTLAQTGSSGATGPPGQEMPPMCQTVGCQNGGSCQPAGFCSCPGIYIGTYCEKISCLANNPRTVCGDNGFCDDSSETGGCICSDGYSGAKCDQVEEHCVPNPCANGGTCINSPIGYNCMCNGPWGGRNCDVHQPCRGLQCVNGDCRQMENGDALPTASCHCERGWEGELCNIDKNECLTGEGGCLNGGTCVNLEGRFTCNCPSQTSGTYCEIDTNGRYTNLCENVTCSNGGSCSNDQPWRPRCDCQPGWDGATCDRAACMRGENFDPYNYGDGGYDYNSDIQNADYAYRIFEDYCLFDGQCFIDSPTSLPRCVCKQGYAGARCFYRTTILQSINPLKSPADGGTEITVTGINLNGTYRPQIRFEGRPCPLVFGNNSIIVCRTLPAADIGVDIDTPLNITLLWARNNRQRNPPLEFTYKPNPTITTVRPLASIISGGVKLTVTGVGLDAVGKPTLEITVVYRGMPVYVFGSLCTIINSTTMECPTPKLEITDSDGNIDFSMLPTPTPPPYPPGFGPGQPARKRRSLSTNEQLSEEQGSKLGILSMLSTYLHRTRRQAADTKLTEFRINNETVEFHIGFKLDGVATYRNLSETLPQYSKLTVYVDPNIERWTDNQEVRIGNRILEVQGDRLIVGIKETDYEMLIGGSKCINLEVYNNKLVCTAPSSTPTPHEADTTTQGVFNVRVHIGVFKEPFLVGKVTYKTSFFDNPQAKWGVIGACIAAGLIICIIIAVWIARKTAK